MSEKINLKEKVEQVLKLQNHSYSELAEHVGLSENELDKQFADNSLEVRTLELISKALRIPLYSLFRNTTYEFKYDEELYYNVDIWGKEGIELRTVLKKDSQGNIAEGEIEKLRTELQEKEKLLKEMETKLKGK